MRYKIFVISLLICVITSPIFAQVTQQNETITWNGAEHVKNNPDILQGNFDMCECIKEGEYFYPEKSITELNTMCLEGFKEYLAVKSRLCNCITTGIFINEYCDYNN